MIHYYSKTTNTFYPSILLEKYKANGNLPEDIREVSDAEYKEYSQPSKAPAGKVRGTTSKGKLCWVDKPEDSDELKAQLARIWRNDELLRADVELNKVQDGMGKGTVGEWRAYRVALRTWPETSDFPAVRPTAPDA